MKHKVVFLMVLAFLFTACSVLPIDTDSTMSISIALPARGSKELGSKTIPADLDGMYIQAVDGLKVISNSFAAVSASATQVTISMAVPQGIHTIHAFATKDNCIIGLAMVKNVSVEAGNNQTLSLTMFALVSAEGSMLGNFDPTWEQSYSNWFDPADLPAEFYSYLISGATRLYAKRNNDWAIPEAAISWDDSTESFSASTQDSDGGLLMEALIPPGTFDWDESASLWFVVSWAGCPVVFTYKLPQNADIMQFRMM